MTNHSLYDEHLPHEELKYREHFQRGNDFCKIELFRSAREEYKQALYYKPGDPLSEEKVIECITQIRKDARKVYIIVPIVLAIIIAIILLS